MAVEVGNIWTCKIGEHQPMVEGADLLMRQAVEEAYREITGHLPAFTFSGWGGELTEVERAAVENREPRLLSGDQTPNLGCATTMELIAELQARAVVAATIGEEWPYDRTVDA